MRMNIQPIHKQRRMLRPIRVPAALEHIVGKRADGVEILVGIGWIRGFGGGADREVGEKQYRKYEQMCMFL